MKANRCGADHTDVWCPEHQPLHPLLYVPPGAPCPWPACEYGTAAAEWYDTDGQRYVRSGDRIPFCWERCVHGVSHDTSREGT